MFRFDASVGLRKRHAGAAARVAASTSVRTGCACRDDALLRRCRSASLPAFVERVDDVAPDDDDLRYISRNISSCHATKQLFGFLSSFIHMRSTAMRIEDATRDGRHRSDASTGPPPKSSIIGRVNERLGERANLAHVCASVRFGARPHSVASDAAGQCRSRARRMCRCIKAKPEHTHAAHIMAPTIASRTPPRIPQKTGHRHMDRAEHISIEQTSGLPADELDRCDSRSTSPGN